MAGTQWLPADRRTRKLAIQAYLISSHVSLVFVMAGLLLRASQSGSFSFDAFRHLGITTDPLTFGLIFVGLAIRAGVVPFHIWIPLAHPSSPTNTHALSLGVAIKVPIYLMIRVFFGLLGPIPGWWGPVVLVFAALTAVVGTFYAMASLDLKTALSYSSIENVGIILVGVGLALTLAGADLRGAPTLLGLASLALVACLYHAVNHALFKGLLYLATGTIEKLTGTVDYHWLGGLIKSIPWSAWAFLVGAVAIAGFPPFNGFISEWLTLQGLFAALSAFSTAGLILPACATVVAIALLALTFGLTAFTFVKIAGTAILGAPRRALAVSQHKVPWFVHVIFAGLGCMCLLLGIFPLPFLGLLAQVTQALGLPGLALTGWASVILINSNAGFGGNAYTVTLNNGLLWLLAAAFVVLVVSVAFQKRIRRNTKVPLPVWSSGIRYDSMHMQASGDYFGYQVDVPLRRKKPGVLAGDGADGTHTGLSFSRPPHVGNAEIIPEGLPISDRYLVIEFSQKGYNFCLTSLRRFASWTTLLLQNGRERVYVVYTVITLVALLAAWFMWGGR